MVIDSNQKHSLNAVGAYTDMANYEILLYTDISIHLPSRFSWRTWKWKRFGRFWFHRGHEPWTLFTHTRGPCEQIQSVYYIFTSAFNFSSFRSNRTESIELYAMYAANEWWLFHKIMNFSIGSRKVSKIEWKMGKRKSATAHASVCDERAQCSFGLISWTCAHANPNPDEWADVCALLVRQKSLDVNGYK